MVGLLKGINIVAKKLGISVDTGKGYRALANVSEHGGKMYLICTFIYLEVKSWQNGWVSKKVEII